MTDIEIYDKFFIDEEYDLKRGKRREQIKYELEQAREKLEGIGLLKTYIKEGNTNNYVYLLYSPLSSEEIFNHPILNVVLYSNLGKEEYNKLINLFKVPRINLKDYSEIKSNFELKYSFGIFLQ